MNALHNVRPELGEPLINAHNENTTVTKISKGIASILSCGAICAKFGSPGGPFASIGGFLIGVNVGFFLSLLEESCVHSEKKEPDENLHEL